MNVAQDKRRRDWSIIIFILPLGVVMMMCVGQLAIRMSPSWSVSGDMNSSLDPEHAPKQNVLVIPPISSDILTPVTWWDTFLTPMSGDEGGGVVVFPPFITFEPSATPSATASSSATPVTITFTTTATGTPPPPSGTPTKKPTDDTPTVIATTGTPTVTTTVTTTSTPTTCTDPAASNFGGPLPCTYPPTTCTDPAASNFGGPLPCTYPPTTCTDPAASNFGGPLPCTYPPTTCTDPAANNNGGPLPCIYPVSSTPEGTQTAVPTQVTVGTPDGSLGIIDDGDYIVLDLTLSGTPIVVTDPSDTNYDIAYYERFTAGGVDMDSVIISISMDDIDYYVVFNWGNGAPDNNSNVGDVVINTGTENDNQHIDSSELHDAPGGPASGTGILIDVDNAPSNPPPGNYWYVAVEAPAPPPPPPVVPTDGADVDSIEIVDIAPTPTP